MILSDATIRKLCNPPSFVGHTPMIQPFNERTREFGMTYGLSPSGYDMRVEFDADGSKKNHMLMPGEFLLASTIEEFCMPQDVVGIVHDKSTWARRGLAAQNTVIEPGWTGFLTLELTNHGLDPILLERGMPIVQVIFHRTDQMTSGYEGKYQDQRRGPVEPINDK